MDRDEAKMIAILRRVNAYLIDSNDCMLPIRTHQQRAGVILRKMQKSILNDHAVYREHVIELIEAVQTAQLDMSDMMKHQVTMVGLMQEMVHEIVEQEANK